MCWEPVGCSGGAPGTRPTRSTSAGLYMGAALPVSSKRRLGTAARVGEVYRYLITRLRRRPFVGPVHGAQHRRSRAMEGAGDAARPESPPITLITSAESWNPLTEPVSCRRCCKSSALWATLVGPVRPSDPASEGGAYQADDVLFGYAADQGRLPRRTVRAPRCSVASCRRSGATTDFDPRTRPSYLLDRHIGGTDAWP